MVIIIGKSGSGKTTVVEELKKRGWNKIVTYTTRPKRPGEIDGVDYNYVSPEEFEELERQDKFVETTTYNTVCGVWRYGTAADSFRDCGDNVIILNPRGVESVKAYKAAEKVKAYKAAEKSRSWIKFKVVYLNISDRTIMRRLKGRGDNPDEVARRLKTDEVDFANIRADLTIDVDEMSTEDVADAIERFMETGRFAPEEDYDYSSASFGDYSPRNPWDAPGMSISDFI